MSRRNENYEIPHNDGQHAKIRRTVDYLCLSERVVPAIVEVIPIDLLAFVC